MIRVALFDKIDENNLSDIWEKVTRLREKDSRDGGNRTESFLAGLSTDCQTRLQMYVFSEHGERAADELCKLLCPDSQFSEWVDTQFGH